MSEDTILVLSQGVHGMPVTDYAAAIRERLPEYDVAVAESRRAERERIAEARIATDRAIDADLLDRASNLQLFACLSAGYGHLPLARLADAGVAVTNASGVHGPNVAEQTLGWMLLYARRLREGLRRQRKHEWRHFQAGELQGSTVTVVGLGAIGEALVRRLDGFGVHTVGVRYTPEKRGPTDEVVGIESPDFEDVLARTDYLVLACPLTDETERLLGEREFTTLPSDAFIVNVARGRVVETDALVDALRSGGGIGGAALDVTDPEPLPSGHDLWDLENALVTPHMAGHTPQYYERRADILARNVRRLEEDGEDADLENRIALTE